MKKYKEWAEAHQLLTGELPPLELQALLEQTMLEAEPPQNVSTVEPYRTKVEQWVKEKVEVKAMYERLKEQGSRAPYMASRRLGGQYLEQNRPGIEVNEMPSSFTLSFLRIFP